MAPTAAGAISSAAASLSVKLTLIYPFGVAAFTGRTLHLLITAAYYFKKLLATVIAFIINHWHVLHLPHQL